MIDKVSNCLVDFDFFGKFYYFTFNKDERLRSVCGGVVSFLVVLGFFISLWFMGKEIIFKTSPLVLYNNNLDSNRYDRQMRVPFGFVIENLNGIVLENYERYFTFSALYINFSKADYTKDFTIKKIEIPMRLCKSEDFSLDPEIQTSFISNNLKNAFCLDNLSQTIGGSWGNMRNFYINVTLEPCKNSTTNSIKCAPEEEIRYFIVQREIQVSIYFEDMILTSTNNEKPLTKFMNSDHQRIQLNSAKINEYFLQDVKVATDNGYIFPSVTNHFTQILTNRFQDFYNNNNQFTDNKVISAITFSIFASVNRYEIFRSYVKIQDILAQLGGVLKVLFMTIEGIFFLIYSHKHHEILIQNLVFSKGNNKNNKKSLEKIDFHTKYNIKQTQNDVVKTTNSQFKEEGIINLKVEKKETDLNASNQLLVQNNMKDKLFIEEGANKNDITNSDANEIDYKIDKISKEFFENECKFDENKLNFPYYEIFFLVFCGCFSNQQLRKKENHLNNLVEYVKKYSDGLQIIKSVAEFEKLKSVIFDEKQLALFSLLSYPHVPVKSFDSESKINFSSKSKSAKFEMAKNYLSHLKSSKNPSFMDRRIIELFGK